MRKMTNAEEKDCDFKVPRTYGAINWINIVALLTLGCIGVTKGIDRVQTDGWGGIGLIAGSVVLTVWLIAMWRFLSEFVLVSFEHLRVFRQLRERQNEIGAVFEQGVDMLGTVVRDLSGIKMTLLEMQADIQSLQGGRGAIRPQEPASRYVQAEPVRNEPMPTQPILTTCPFCGKKTEIPSGVVSGQHIRCPYCRQKFTI